MNYLIYCILVILPIYTDSPLGLIFGASGYSILTPLSLIMMASYMLINKKIVLSKIEKKMFRQTLFIISGSIIGIILWIARSGNITEYGENLIIKSLKVILNYVSYPAYLFLLSNSMKKFSIEKISRPIFAVLIFLSIFSLIEYNNIPYAFEPIHFNSSFPYYRVRLLTMESSFTASMIIVYFAISCFYFIYKNNYLGIIITMLSVVALMATTTSKSLMICFIIMIAINIFNIAKSKRKSKYIQILLFVAIFILACVFILPVLQLNIKDDLKSYTSTATRIYTFVISLLTGLIVPFGVGGAYLGFFPTIMREMLGSYKSLPFNFNVYEILFMINNDTDFAVSTSSGLMQFHMYWGIVGSVIFYRILFSPIKAFGQIEIKGKSFLISALIVLILSITFSSPFSYDFLLLFAFCIYIVKNKFKEGDINENRN